MGGPNPNNTRPLRSDERTEVVQNFGTNKRKGQPDAASGHCSGAEGGPDARWQCQVLRRDVLILQIDVLFHNHTQTLLFAAQLKA